MPNPLLELTGATVDLGGRRVLSDRSLRLMPGEILPVTGPNGSGKSTLLRVLAGEIKAGELRIDGKDACKMGCAELAEKRAWLEQQPTCAWDLAVHEVVQLGGGDAGAALAQVGMTAFHDRNIHELSGGEQRMVHVARCLAQLGAPMGKILLLDEPDSGLDENRRARLDEVVRAFAAAGGGVILATHRVGE